MPIGCGIWVPSTGGAGGDTPRIADLLFRFRADTNVTTSAGPVVDSWAAHTPDGSYAVSAAGTVRPAYSASGGPNGQSTITYDDTNDNLIQDGGDLPSSAISDDYTVFAVVECASEAHQWVLSTGSADFGFMIHSDIATQPGVYSNTSIFRATTIDTSPTTPQILAFALDRSAGTCDVYQNGRGTSEQISSITFVDGNRFTSRFEIGGLATFNLRFDGDISEVVCYKRLLAAAEIDQEFQYLGSRYGITIS